VSFRLRGEGIIKFELDNIEGTQIPTKIPDSLSPLNQRYIENMKDKNAANPHAILALT
jgi:hypothetical protein